MANMAMRAEGLGKVYRVGRGWAESKPTLGGKMIRAVTAPVRNFREVRRLTNTTDGGDDLHWALRDVSFEIGHGEVVGVIGRNGAGKSTLLKLLSRITAPSKGRATIRGRVGSLLEVGTGFHPDLTGRENIFLNGAILGMDRSYVERRFDEIVEFSGVEKFIDTPVKRYSSGMYLRLAFAVAAHLEAEIMIVDEVLAVGDAAFQKKCLGKMSSVGKEGRTVLFVSHNLTAVRTLCQRALLLRGGTLVADLSAAEAVERYVSEIRDYLPEQRWDDPASAPQNTTSVVHRVAMRGLNGESLDELTTSTPFRVDIDYTTKYEGSYPSFQLTVFDLENNPVFSTFSNREPNYYGRPLPIASYRTSCLVPANLLNAQGYTVDITIFSTQFSDWHTMKDVLRFEVSDSPELRVDYFREYVGAVRPDIPWQTERVQPAEGAAS